MSSSHQLVRGLSVWDTSALVVGTVIGTGVFLKAATMSQSVGSPLLVLAAWVAAGLLSLAGALTYAELSSMMPEAGGEYVFLRKAFGTSMAFLFGWQRFVVAGSASIASLGVGFAIFLASVVPLDHVWLAYDLQLPIGDPIHWKFGSQQVAAVAVIFVLTVVNCFTVAFGGKVHLFLTTLKIAGIAFVAGGIFLFAKDASGATSSRPPRPLGLPYPRLGPRCWQRFGDTMVGTTCRWPREKCGSQERTFLEP